MTMDLGWEPSRGARYAEKWWKRNGYVYQRVASSVDEDEYIVEKPGMIQVRYAIVSRETDFAGAMKKFQLLYETKAAAMKLPESKSGVYALEELDS